VGGRTFEGGVLAGHSAVLTRTCNIKGGPTWQGITMQECSLRMLKKHNHNHKMLFICYEYVYKCMDVPNSARLVSVPDPLTRSKMKNAGGGGSGQVGTEKFVFRGISEA